MLVEVVESRCRQVAKVLTTVNVPSPVEPWSVHSTDVDFDLATLNLVLVAVCHQTQAFSGSIGGKQYRGWDYLQKSFLAWAQEETGRVSTDRFAGFSIDDFDSILGLGDRLSHADREHRTSLVRDCGDSLSRMGFRSCSDIFEYCGGRVADGEDNILDTLRSFKAFRDPVRKKSLFLLGLNAATCGWEYADKESLDPPVDYHEVRGHLRLGTVVIRDSALLDCLRHARAVNEVEDVAIRMAVTGAIRRISESSGFSPMQLHYLFWNLFRSICLRGKPICRGDLTNRLPQAYQYIVADGSCCFAQCCDSVDLDSAIDEHRFETSWY